MDAHSEWGTEDGQRLREDRRRLGHTQSQAAAALRRYGAAQASQASVSEWENNQAVPARTAREAIARYCSRIEIDFPPYDSDEDQTQEPQGGLEDLGMDSFVRSMTGEPMLGPLQQRAVEAVLARINSSTGPLTEADDQIIARIFAVLALPGPREVAQRQRPPVLREQS